MRTLTPALLVLAVIMLGRVVSAQASVSADLALAKRGSVELNRYAKACQTARFEARARAAWLEVVGAYDTDNEEARLGLGHKRVGTLWAPPSETSVLVDKGNAKAVRKLDQMWIGLARTLSAQHRRVAILCSKDLDEERAEYHLKRVVRFLPSDKRVAKELGLQNLGGVYGTEGDIRILRRSVMLERVVADLKQRSYVVEDLPAEERNPMLDRTSLNYIGVRSENFTIWGTAPKSMLERVAVTAERALAFSRAIFAGYPSYESLDGLIRNRALFATKNEYIHMVRSNMSSKAGEYGEYLATKTGGCTLTNSGEKMRVSISGSLEWNTNTLMGAVVSEASGLRTEGLTEGMGHAAAGMFYGQSLGGGIDMNRDRTRTGSEARETRSMDTWRALAVATAWQQSGTPVASLPLLKTSKFRLEDRIKSWAFTDYVLRRNPSFLRWIDDTKKAGAKGPDAVSEKFDEVSDGPSLTELETDYRSYWTEKAWLRKAVTTAMHTREAKTSRLWWKKINQARVGVQRGPVAHWPSDPKVVKQLVSAIRAMGKKDGASLQSSMPVLWTKTKKAGAAIEAWLYQPGFRNLLLHPHISGLSFVSSGGVTALYPEMLPADTGMVGCYPAAGNLGLPPSCELVRLGPTMAKLLGEMGVKGEAVGYPISLHLFRESELEASEVTCQVTAESGDIEGFVYAAQGDADARTGGAGLFVFFPLAPLPSGEEITVDWSFPSYAGKAAPYSFTTR